MLNKLALVLPKDLSAHIPAELLPAGSGSVSIYDAYEMALEGHSLDRIERACQNIVRHEKFFPVPAKIIEYYNALPRDDDQLALPEPAPTADDLRRGRLLMRYSRHCLQTKETPTSQGAADYVNEHRDDDLSQTPFGQEESDLTPIGKVVADLQGVRDGMTADELQRLRLTEKYFKLCDKTGRKWDSEGEAKYIKDHWNEEVVNADG